MLRIWLQSAMEIPEVVQWFIAWLPLLVLETEASKRLLRVAVFKSWLQSVVEIPLFMHSFMNWLPLFPERLFRVAVLRSWLQSVVEAPVFSHWFMNWLPLLALLDMERLFKLAVFWS